MPKCSTSPTCRGWRAPGSSPRCSRPTRRATGRWPKRGSGPTGSAEPMRGRRWRAAGRGSPSGRTSRSNRPTPSPALRAAVSRQDPSGQPAGGWRPQERVSFDAALAGFTRGAAYAGFAENRIGSLDPGKYADFILVDRDISTPPGRPRAHAGDRDMGRRPDACGSARLTAGSASAVAEHRRGEDLRQFLGLACAGFVPQIKRHPGARA